MGRNIVICCDGTGNDVEADESNVLRLERMLVRDDDQVTYYDPGVGTQGAPTLDFISRQELLRVLGMGLGMGAFDRIGSSYRFLMRTYRPDDRIYIFGFSRGAYVARALAGLVAKMGVLEASRENLVPYAMKLYAAPANAPIVAPFCDTFATYRPEIAFLGLWDTVKSVYQFDPRRAAFTSVSLPLTFDNSRVRVIRHAIALDERRRFYRTNLWIGHSQYTNDQDVRQVWFPGVHSDVGGSYPDAEGGLSKIALEWMVREARHAGVRIDQLVYDLVVPLRPVGPVSSPDHTAMLHNSLTGVWRLFEWWPPFPRGKRRFVPEGAFIHRSVANRIREVHGYRPYLPRGHVFVD
ncbi:DUF2235 domain-containing protein [Mesorhizobium sp. M0847]|uniref:DUF2235 domain-containing protein n=1 Tax=unclassified Mesorhizobium TaxID=325217 RepID=UPI00333C5C4E